LHCVVIIIIFYVNKLQGKPDTWRKSQSIKRTFWRTYFGNSGASTGSVIVNN